MQRIILLALLLLTSAVNANALTGIVFDTRHGGAAAYTGPCDVLTCAEAYSVTRAMKASYNGDLFQLHNGTTTLNVGQDANHAADMTTWSAFCSAVQSNCKVTKIYAQIQGSANDLSPSQVHGSTTDCTATPRTCAAPFTIEVATGLPIMTMTNPYQYIIGATTDDAATGINAGTAAMSAAMNFKVQQVAKCCGSFGIAHLWSSFDTPGTDFELFQSYNTGIPGYCAIANELCLGLDLEGLPGTPITDASAISAGDHGFLVGTFGGTGTNRFTVSYNGTTIQDKTATGQNSGSRVHLGAGGDLAQPADIIWREGLITNSEISSSDNTSLFSNQTAFYSALTFKTQNNSAYALVAHGINPAAGQTGNNTTTSSLNTTGANLLVCATSWFTGGTFTSVTDSRGNSWSHGTIHTSSPGRSQDIEIWYSVPTSVGAGHTFTANTAGGFPSIACAAFSGRTSASPFDNENGSGNASPGSLTPSLFNELQVTGISTNGTPATISDRNLTFTVTDTNLNTGASAEGLGLAYTVQAGATTAVPNWTPTGGGADASTIMGFKP